MTGETVDTEESRVIQFAILSVNYLLEGRG